MEEINYILGYKGLKIYQNSNWFKFSLDSVILAHFVNIHKKDKIIDLGTGNAIIPLLLSAKYSNKIIGLEIQEELIDLAQKSVIINAKNDQIEIISGDVKLINKFIPNESFDIVICNPPYFKNVPASLQNHNLIKAQARHEILLDLDSLFKSVAFILKNTGSFYMVHRTTRLNEIMQCLEKYKLRVKEIMFSYPNQNTTSNMVFLKIVKSKNPELKVLSPLFIHKKNGEYTARIKRMLGD